MDEVILIKLLEIAPQLALLVLFLISLWLLLREYRSLRKDMDSAVDNTVDAKLGALIGKVQIESAKVTNLLDEMHDTHQTAQDFYSSFETSIIERSDQLNLTLDDVEKKLELLGQAIPKEIPYSARDYSVLARQANSLGEAISYIEKAENDPDATSKDLETLGDTAKRLRKWSIARNLYEQAVEKDPENLSAQIEYYCLIAETVAEERADKLEQAVKLVIDTLDGGLLSRLSNTYIEFNWYPRLESLCRDILKKQPEKESNISLVANRNLAVALKEQGKFKGAEEHFLAGLAVDSEDENLLKAFLGLLTAQGLHDKALEISTKLLEIDPLDPNYYYFHGRELIHLNRNSEADYWYNLAENLYPEGAQREVVRRERMKLKFREEISQKLHISADNS